LGFTWGKPISSSLASTTSSDSEIALNPIVASVKVSKTIEIFSLVKQMEADGEEVTLLCVGEPDFLPPKAVLHRGPEIVIFLGLLIGYSLQRECQYFLYNFDTFQEFEHRPRLLYSKVTLDTRLLLEQLP
jgi:hypothetical protein